MKGFFSFLAGLLCGALVGGVAALLFAPMSGQELQTEAQARMEKVMDDVKRTIEEERHRLEEELEALKRGEIKVG